jgi:hypothetical protein
MQSADVMQPGTRYEAAPPPGYRCLLDRQPDVWVPRALRAQDETADVQWIVNPRMRYVPAGSPHNDSALFGNAVRRTESTVWVADPVTEVLAPFVASEELSPCLATLQPGAPLPSSTASAIVPLLRSAGIVYDPHALERKRREWQAHLERAQALFQNGYADLGCLLHAFTIGAARTYFRRLIRLRRARFGDGQSARRWVQHNEIVARFFHHQLTPIVASVAGIALKPSYVYFSCYEGGAELPWHTDRKQCEVSLSMLIDYSPQPAAEAPWPLLLQTRQGVVPVHQRIGDTLAYRGCEVPHAREALAADHTSMHLFLHYVPQDFSGPLD